MFVGHSQTVSRLPKYRNYKLQLLIVSKYDIIQEMSKIHDTISQIEESMQKTCKYPFADSTVSDEVITYGITATDGIRIATDINT